MDSICDVKRSIAVNALDIGAEMDRNTAVACGAHQLLFGHAGTAFDAGIRGFAIELNGVPAEKRRFFK
jgi:hypothetical protein